MANNFINQIENKHTSLKEENVYEGIFKEYERIIIQSLITSFGLDFLISDQYGGDVDTVHNVRQVSVDEHMNYKNKKNQESYEQKGEYKTADYHKDKQFSNVKSAARQEYDEYGTMVRDAYTGKDNLEYTKASAVPPERQIELDHIVECKAIHDDRGRVLSRISGVDLANQADNYAWTNKSLNASMGKWAERKNARYKEQHKCDAPISEVDMEAFLREYPQSPSANPKILAMISDPETKQRMLNQYAKSRKVYEQRISTTYYTSSSFMKATAKASTIVGFKMGLRQALGLVFSEIWFAVRDEIRQGKEDGKALFNSIGSGVKKGFENAKLKYKELWHKFIEGAIGGVLASLTTTLCNIFFITAKNVIRIIRQSWASLVEATKILLFNPDFLPFGERFRATAKIIATGASVVAGTMVGELIAKTGIAAIPVVGYIVQTFCGTLVTGIMSCSLLYLLDKNSAVNKIVEVLNSIPTIDDIVVYYRIQAQLLEEYCAKLMDIDLGKFQKEIESYNEALCVLENTGNQHELNLALRSIYKELELNSPLGNHTEINSFMADKDCKLKFC